MSKEKCIYDDEVECYTEYNFDCQLCFKERGMKWSER